MEKAKTKTIDYRLNVLRVISMIMVIIIHVANYYCRAFNDINFVSYSFAVVLNTISRISVPIFFMISGSLLLSSSFSYKKNKKRTIRKIIELIVITIIYLVSDYFLRGNVSDNLLELFFRPDRTMLWFMYAIIVIYIALPFLKILVDGMTEKDEKIFIVLWLIFCGISNFSGLFIGAKVSYPIPILGTFYVGYFIVGYIIYKHIDLIDFKKYRYYFLGIIILCFVVNIVITLIYSSIEQKFYDNFLTYKSILCIIASVLTFIYIYCILENKPNKIIEFMARDSFEIYLVHGIILDLVMLNTPFKNIFSIVGIPIFTVVIYIFSEAVVYLYKFIFKLFKK